MTPTSGVLPLVGNLPSTLTWADCQDARMPRLSPHAHARAWEHPESWRPGHQGRSTLVLGWRPAWRPARRWLSGQVRAMHPERPWVNQAVVERTHLTVIQLLAIAIGRIAGGERD